MKMQAVICTVALSIANAVDAQDTIRCKSALVTVGMVAAEVLARCGDPQHKDVQSVPVRARRANGSSHVVGTTQIERWTYDRGPGQFPALLTFEEGKLTNVELITRR